MDALAWLAVAWMLVQGVFMVVLLRYRATIEAFTVVLLAAKREMALLQRSNAMVADKLTRMERT